MPERTIALQLIGKDGVTYDLRYVDGDKYPVKPEIRVFGYMRPNDDEMRRICKREGDVPVEFKMVPGSAEIAAAYSDSEVDDINANAALKNLYFSFMEKAEGRFDAADDHCAGHTFSDAIRRDL